MTLEHKLSCASSWVPKLDTSVLGSRENPIGIGCKGYGQHKVTVTLKRLNTLATFGRRTLSASWGTKFPHFDGSVQAATDKVLAIGRECHRVNRILVSVRAFEAFNQKSRVNVPDAYTLVQGTSSNILGIGRNGNSGDAIFNSEGQRVGALLNIP